MLLSSTAEAMFWTGRYLERAQAVARAALAYQRMSLDLPGVRWLDVRPLLGLSARQAPGDNRTATETSGPLRELVLDADNPSTVLGALRRARANLRRGRVTTPFEVWVTLNAVYVRLSEVDAGQTASVFGLLGEVVAAGSRIEGEITATMTRDAAYSFLRIGCHLERADMLVRTMKALLPVVSPSGPEQTFDDVRSMGLLDAVGAHSMYRRRHHARIDLPAVLEFLVLDAAFPRSLTHCLHVIDAELRNLPRPGEGHPERLACLRVASELARTSPDGVPAQLSLVLNSLAALHAAVKASYFPDLPEATLPIPSLRAQPPSIPPTTPYAAELTPILVATLGRRDPAGLASEQDGGRALSE
jgi:uncharacterized alpha-E superfamily protein